jgi:hypothetical protein
VAERLKAAVLKFGRRGQARLTAAKHNDASEWNHDHWPATDWLSYPGLAAGELRWSYAPAVHNMARAVA